jgi:hypothetical protein
VGEDAESSAREVTDSMPMLRGGEKVLMQEKCTEEGVGSGILTLTNSRLTFERQQGLLSKKTQTEFAVGLDGIHNVWTEGLVMKKLAMELSWSRGPGRPETIDKRKFSVSRPAEWETTIKSVVQQQ